MKLLPRTRRIAKLYEMDAESNFTLIFKKYNAKKKGKKATKPSSASSTAAKGAKKNATKTSVKSNKSGSSAAAVSLPPPPPLTRQQSDKVLTLARQGSQTHRWEFMLGSNNGWGKFDSEASKLVELEYQAWLLQPSVFVRSVRSGDFHYSINFNTMEQTNMSHNNHRVRKIRRVAAAGGGDAGSSSSGTNDNALAKTSLPMLSSVFGTMSLSNTTIAPKTSTATRTPQTITYTNLISMASVAAIGAVPPPLPPLPYQWVRTLLPRFLMRPHLILSRVEQEAIEYVYNNVYKKQSSDMNNGTAATDNAAVAAREGAPSTPTAEEGYYRIVILNSFTDAAGNTTFPAANSLSTTLITPANAPKDLFVDFAAKPIMTITTLQDTPVLPTTRKESYLHRVDLSSQPSFISTRVPPLSPLPFKWSRGAFFKIDNHTQIEIEAAYIAWQAMPKPLQDRVAVVGGERFQHDSGSDFTIDFSKKPFEYATSNQKFPLVREESGRPAPTFVQPLGFGVAVPFQQKSTVSVACLGNVLSSASKGSSNGDDEHGAPSLPFPDEDDVI